MASSSKIPVLHYLDLGSLGRGEVIRLFLKDAGIEFKDIRYKYDDTWPATSKVLQDRGISKSGKVPQFEYEGKILSQHVPMLRYLARKLGSYDGETSYEKYLVDLVADLYIDWRSQWASQLSKKTDDFAEKTVPVYYELLATYYSEIAGPYLLGDRISYADFAVYQSIDNTEKIGTVLELPEALKTLQRALEARPNVAAYLESGRATTKA